MTYNGSTTEERTRANELRRRAYAKQAPSYDKTISFFERRVFGTHHRPWACSHAGGKTLEVAIGTGLNLPHYPEGIELSGLDLTAEMLGLARERAAQLGVAVDLQQGDAQELPFPDESFDTVLCTYSLCNIPDVERAVAEMKRVLKARGRLILVDHVRSTNKAIHLLQRGLEYVSKKIEGEHLTRRPSVQVEAAGLAFEVRERSRVGLVERVVARKPLG